MLEDWFSFDWALLLIGLFLIFGQMFLILLIARLEHAFLSWTETLFTLERRSKEREP